MDSSMDGPMDDSLDSFDWDAFAQDFAEHAVLVDKARQLYDQIAKNGAMLRLAAQAKGYSFDAETYVLTTLTDAFLHSSTDYWVALIEDGRLIHSLAERIAA